MPNFHWSLLSDQSNFGGAKVPGCTRDCSCFSTEVAICLPCVRGEGEERGCRNFKRRKGKDYSTHMRSTDAHRRARPSLRCQGLSAFVGQTTSFPYELRQLRLEKLFYPSEASPGSCQGAAASKCRDRPDIRVEAQRKCQEILLYFCLTPIQIHTHTHTNSPESCLNSLCILLPSQTQVITLRNKK